MRRVKQIWRLWSEELKPKWSAFTPTCWFKRIICPDWSISAPSFLLLVREWQLKAEAWWRRRIKTNSPRGDADRKEENPWLSSRTTWCLYSDGKVWTYNVSNPARGDRLVVRVREDLASNIASGQVREVHMGILKVSDIQMVFALNFSFPLSLFTQSEPALVLWRSSAFPDLSHRHVNILPQLSWAL